MSKWSVIRQHPVTCWRLSRTMGSYGRTAIVEFCSSALPMRRLPERERETERERELRTEWYKLRFIDTGSVRHTGTAPRGTGSGESCVQHCSRPAVQSHTDLIGIMAGRRWPERTTKINGIFVCKLTVVLVLIPDTVWSRDSPV